MDATAWATVGLVIFLAIVVYAKVPAMMARSLDERAAKIKAELDEARRLREESQALLAEYQRKRKEAEQEAAGIVSAAEREASQIVSDAKAKTEEYIQRRTVMAEQKIAQAERDAVNEVRARAAEVAVEAARSVLAGKVDGRVSEDLFKSSLTAVRANMN